MSFDLISKPKTVKVTREIAKAHAEMDPAPRDRPLSERRLDVYERLFKEGKFRPCTWATAYCVETDGLYRVNGKHTSTLISRMSKIPDYYIVLEEYKCDTLEDVASLYSTFDSKMQQRSATDIYLSFAGTVEELREIPVRTITVAVSGMSLCVEGIRKWSSQPADRAEYLLENPGFVVWLNTILVPTVEDYHGPAATVTMAARHLHRSPVVAAMFETWKKDTGKANEFWLAVRDQSGVNNSPDRKLAYYLTTTSMHTTDVRSARGDGAPHQAGPREIRCKSLYAWNAWRKGVATSLRYSHKNPIPEAV